MAKGSYTDFWSPKQIYVVAGVGWGEGKQGSMDEEVSRKGKRTGRHPLGTWGAVGTLIGN
jgi:hypothetical protein